MGRVPDFMLRSVAFIGDQSQGHPFEVRGTAFLVGYPLSGWERDLEPPQPIEKTGNVSHATYLVSARHTIEGIRAGGRQPHLRTNDMDGNALQPIKVPLEGWYELPNDPDTGYYHDVAVFPLDFIEGVDLAYIPLEWSALPNRIKDANIGLGDDVFFPGLFYHRVGENKNIPIIRKGTLAAMVDWNEPVLVKKRDGENVQEVVHLIEIRSISGFSGSPVFAHPVGVREDPDTHEWTVKSYHEAYLLGLMAGHWDEPHMREDGETEKVNVGVGYVTPVEKILEALDMPEIEQEREKRAKTEADKLVAATQDDLSEEPTYTRADYLGDLHKATRPFPPEQSDQEA